MLACIPLMHESQALLPGDLEYVATAHSVHRDDTSAFSMVEYFPGGHNVQDVDA
jgi:hypothetical protein